MNDNKDAIRMEIRSVWDADGQRWLYSVVDIIGILTGSKDPRHYWTVLKQRLREDGNETVTNCERLKLPAADGKMRMTDAADTERILQIIQFIPSKRAEPFRRWIIGNRQGLIDRQSKQKAEQLFDSGAIDGMEAGTANGSVQIRKYLFGGLCSPAGQIRGQNISKHS